MYSKLLSIVVILLAAVTIGYGLTRTGASDIGDGQQRLDEGMVTIRDTALIAELARTDDERRMGLSGRVFLREGAGMLFAFPSTGRLGFWMKDMRFSLDLAWIDDEFSIVHIERNVGPETFPRILNPETPARYVLEVTAGVFDIIGMSVGDTMMVEGL